MSDTHKELREKFREAQKWYTPSGWWKIDRRLTSLINALPLLVNLVVLSTFAVAILFVGIYYYFIVIQVPYELGSGLVHHQKWDKSDVFYSLTSLAVITVTIYIISFIRKHDKSIVMTKSSGPLLSPNRVKTLKKIAAIIAAIVAFIAGIVTIIAEMIAVLKLFAPAELTLGTITSC